MRLCVSSCLVGLSLALVFAPQEVGHSAPPPPVFLLTQNSVMAADLSTSRIVARRSLKAGAARKVVSAGGLVLLQGERTVQVLKAQTLETVQTVEFREEIQDIAVLRALLLVASGSEIHIVRIASAGRPSIITSIRLPKGAHALAARGTSIYAIDDVIRPYYSHFIDIQDPYAPRVITMQWGAVSGRLVSQAIADRWYVVDTYQKGITGRRGHSVWALSLKPPIEKLTRWDMGGMPRGWGMRGFRVHADTLYWIWGGGDDRVWLFRRRLEPSDATTEKVIPLGPSGEWVGLTPRGTIELVGSRLYVAAARQLQAFDLDASRPPVRALQFKSPSPILSFEIPQAGR